MNVPWEDVQEDFARKDAEIEKLKTMNAELVEALESELENDYIHPQGKKSIRETLAKAKELNQ
jgi:hypothetical protein